MKLATLFIIASNILCLHAYADVAPQAPDTESANEETVLVLPPLFDYATAPEEIESWADRSNWLVEHFWDNFDFKQKVVGQTQLNHAFKTYIVPMRFADAEVTMKSIKKLIGQLNKNSTLLIQFTKAAERNIYNPATSDMLIDEVYLEFLKALCNNKKVGDLHKARYLHQVKPLENTIIGRQMPKFGFEDHTGVNTEFSPEAITTIIEFGDPDCSECRITRLRLETDTYLQSLAKDGKLRILFISPEVAPEDMSSWRESVKDYPHYWTVGASEDLAEELDLRTTPCIYLIDAQRNIVSKNSTPEAIHRYMEELGN